MKCDWPDGCDDEDAEYPMWKISAWWHDGYYCHAHLYLALKDWYEAHPEQLKGKSRKVKRLKDA